MKILLLSTVSAFFRKRAGLFFVLLGGLFGFMRSTEHYNFALFFLTDPNGIIYLFAIWTCYTFACIQFMSNAWKQPEYRFIFHTSLWSPVVRGKRFFVMGLAFLQPIIGYGIYLSGVAITENVALAVLPIIPIYLFLAAAIALSAEWRIRHPVYSTTKKSSGFVKWPFPRPASRIYWIFEWLFRERGITLLAGKAGALLVTAGTLLYYSTDAYDLRLPAIGLSFAYLLNTGISFELYQWETDVFLWERSLPIGAMKSFARIVIFHAIIILPETLVVVRNQLLTLPEVLQLFTLGIAVLMLVHVVFYKKEGLPESSAQTFLFGFVGLTLLILYKIPLLVISLIMIVFSHFAYFKWRKI